MKRHNTEVSFDKKLKAVKTYQETRQSLRGVSKDFGVSYKTLWNWVQRYKATGEDALRKRKTHKRKISKKLEIKIMFLKEQNPSLSIRRAQQLLKKQGIVLSNKKIWQIWKRYGLAKRSILEPLSPFCAATPESTKGLMKAKKLISQGKLQEAAKLLNSFPCLPHDEVLKEIPKKFLSPRRRLDRLYLVFGDISRPEYSKEAHWIGKTLYKRDHIYSSIIANFLELVALADMKSDERKMTILDHLAKRMRRMKENALWFLLYCDQAMTYSDLLEIGKALNYMKKCRRIVYRLPFPYYQETFGALMTRFGRYKEACSFYTMALKQEKSPNRVGSISLKIACYCDFTAGDYQNCKRMLSKAGVIKDIPGYRATYSLTQAYLSFVHGRLAQANKYFLKSLKEASKEELANKIFAASVGLAGIAMALGKKAEAEQYLRKYLSLLKKYGYIREVLVLNILLGSDKSLPEELICIPGFRFLDLLMQANRTSKIGNYRKAFRFAQRQRLLGLLHRSIVFFPNPVINLLKKGKNTGLPRAILKFPIFNQNIPVYHVKFLGDTIVAKHQRYIRARLSPQEKAFLVHFALRAGAPGKSIPLSDLYRNFWKQSSKPSERLLHLITQVKKKLKIPSHLLSVSSSYGKPQLINRGIHITTDFGEFETLLTQVKSLEQADEWQFAKRDYLRAFALVRDAPFKKMYDDWSEDMRDAFLNKLENEVLNFAKGCLEHHNKKNAEKVLKKAALIIPQSIDVKKMLKNINKYERVP